MSELFSYQFIWFALFASFLVSICSGIIGSIIVANRSVFVAGGVAHMAFGGVGLAIFCGFNTMLGGIIFGVVMALFLSYAFLYQRDKLDSYVGAFWAFGMAMGVIFIDITPGYSADISSYLFGSLLSVNLNEIIAMSIFDIALIIFVGMYYYELMALFYDTQLCMLKGLKVKIWTYIIFVIIAIGVLLSMNVGGLILTVAILSIPAYIAHLFSRSLMSMMWISWLISIIFMWLGFFVAYWFSISIGACIVVILTLAMFIAIIIHKFIRRF